MEHKHLRKPKKQLAKSLEVLVFQRWHQSYIEKNKPGALNKILKGLMQHFVRKTGRITSLSHCAVFTAIDCT